MVVGGNYVYLVGTLCVSTASRNIGLPNVQRLAPDKRGDITPCGHNILISNYLGIFEPCHEPKDTTSA